MRLLLLRFLAEHLANHKALLLAVWQASSLKLGQTVWIVKHIPLGFLGLVFFLLLFVGLLEPGKIGSFRGPLNFHM